MEGHLIAKSVASPTRSRDVNITLTEPESHAMVRKDTPQNAQKLAFQSTKATSRRTSIMARNHTPFPDMRSKLRWNSIQMDPLKEHSLFMKIFCSEFEIFEIIRSLL